MSVLAVVGGDTCGISLAEFKRRCCVTITREQERPNPDNALVGLLCEAVRLAREYERAMVRMTKPEAARSEETKA